MEWKMNNDEIQNCNIFESLCDRDGDKCVVPQNCDEILEEILQKLLNEDHYLRPYRRAIGFNENIRKNLIPLMITVRNGLVNKKLETTIIKTIIKILVNLTIPIECLVNVKRESENDVGRQIIFEINQLLIDSKRAFTDSWSSKVVVEFLKDLIEKKEMAINDEQCENINNCFQLFRNILHIPESVANTSNLQNQIIWNLFTQSLDKIIIHLLSCPMKMYCSITMVQFIALMYKDQSVSHLQKLLGFWFEASLSDSSEDNESNTSPQNRTSGSSSVLLTSDSSDNGGTRIYKNNQKLINNSLKNNEIEDICTKAAESILMSSQEMKRIIKKEYSFESDQSTSAAASRRSSDSGICLKVNISASKQIFLNQERRESTHYTSIDEEKSDEKSTSESNTYFDCKYTEQVENGRGSISTSSNDDEKPYKKYSKPPQKLLKYKINAGVIPRDKKEIRRKRLIRRSKTNTVHMKGLIHHNPTNEDISESLKEFTVDFLLKGYGPLVQDLYTEILTDVNLSIDISHFFWLIIHFLKFASQLELDIQIIQPALSYNTISYLVFQGVWQLEELQICRKFLDVDIHPNLRRLHLVVAAIREFLQTLETYQKISHLSQEDHSLLKKLEQQISEMAELKFLFLLLLREYDPNIQSEHCLEDIIVANHMYLLLLEKQRKSVSYKLNILEHLKEFATIDIMYQYGCLLEKFHENGQFINNCTLTMMHHVAGDLDSVFALYQLNIIKTFLKILETDYNLCDDWSDLIAYVINSFINISEKKNQVRLTASTNTSVMNYGTPDIASEISLENESAQQENEQERNNFHTNMNRNDLVLNAIQFYDQTSVNVNKNKISSLNQNSIEDAISYKSIKFTISKNKEQFSIENSNDEVMILKEHLIFEKKENLLIWLQNILLDVCYAKLLKENHGLIKDNIHLSPILYHCILLNLPIPIVTWTTEQSTITKHETFVLLLTKLGIILPRETGKLFARIPNFWSADYLFSIAQHLGPININKMYLRELIGSTKITTNN